jgi:predicted nucleic acid-binding protein
VLFRFQSVTFQALTLLNATPSDGLNPSAAPAARAPTHPLVVVDTHIILDWWVFGSPDCVLLLEEISARRLSWIATSAMREELVHVLARRCLGPRWPADWNSLQPLWARHALEVDAPTASPAPWPRCTDSDDQKFIDLALARRARWLISRDRAVLKVAGRCRKLGLTVLQPAAWLAEWQSEHAQTRAGDSP